MKQLSVITACIAYALFFLITGCDNNIVFEENVALLTRAGSIEGRYYYAFEEKIPIDKVPNKVVFN